MPRGCRPLWLTAEDSFILFVSREVCPCTRRCTANTGPKTFSEVVGQQHITDTLQRQVADGQVGHAYLFTGTRGTGKTTCARILAKAVNCQHPIDGAPCNQCAACRGIDDGSLLDVTELDAASNGSVNDARSLREEAVYPPAVLQKRVYIIDEVHMLSRDAFNALLKIMEEPPAHLLFILATTEIQKVPGHHTLLLPAVQLQAHPAPRYGAAAAEGGEGRSH